MKFVPFIILVLMAFLYPISYSLTNDQKGLDFSKIISPGQNYNSEAFLFGKKVHIHFNYSVKVDINTGNIGLESRSDAFQFDGSYESNLKIKKTEFDYYHPLAIKLLGYDKRISFYDAALNQSVIKYYRGSLEVKSRAVDWNTNLLDSENALVYIQGMTIAGAESFDRDILIKSMGLKINVHFQKMEKDEIRQLIHEFKTSELLTSLDDSAQHYVAYQMNLNGVFRLLYQNKYYFIFEKIPPYKFIAYWGGEGQGEEFYWFNL